MKQKAIEKIAPVQPVHTCEYITTVQKMDQILILNVYKDGKLRGRHALDSKTGEYSQYSVAEACWKHRKYAALLSIDTTPGGWYCSNDKKRAVIDTPEQEMLVQEELGVSKKVAWKRNTYDLIDDAESDYERKKRQKTEDNRRMRVQDKMNLVPAIPENIHEWIWQQEGEVDYAFLDKETGEWYCTACKKRYTEKLLKRADDGGMTRHNDKAICPECGKVIMAKKRVKEISQMTHFAILQKIDHRMSVARHFDVKMEWDMDGRKIRINEAVRIILNHISAAPRHCAEVFYNQYGTGGVYSGRNGWDYEYSYFDNKKNPAGRHTYAGFLYPEGIEEALKDTAYTVWTRIFGQMAAGRQKLQYNKFMILQNDTRMAGIVEYLFKGRFYKLLRETSEHINWWTESYYGILNPKGKNIEEIFGIRDKQIINRIRDVDGGTNMIRWMRWSTENGQKISQDVLEWLSKNEISQRDVEFIKDRMSIQQVMNYVNRQQAEGYKTKTAGQILNQWSDYLSMLKTLKKNMDDPMMYRPKELKRRHDECVKEIRRQQMIEEMKRNEKQKKEEAERMREKFPGAEEVLKEIKSKYEYKGEKYCIIVPQKLIDIVTEGQALHHCAGATDRYFDRIMQQETYICFLRKTSDPEIPFYTIEVEPGGTIRQHRGLYDEEPGIEKIKPFLREWQKEIKKRMSHQDYERAKVSAVKRQANIEELQAKKNTRVLNALMEDFMEAI